MYNIYKCRFFSAKKRLYTKVILKVRAKAQTSYKQVRNETFFTPINSVQDAWKAKVSTLGS